MVFGKTNKERYQAKQNKLKKLKTNNIHFAWFPVKENYGRWVWLQKVYKDYCIYKYAGVFIKGYKKPIYHLIKE